MRDIVGDEYVRPGTASDAVRGVVPGIVVEPADAAQVAAVLRAADSQRLAVLPRGGGTKGDWGNPPRRGDLVLSTARLDRIVEHAWADLTVTVQAGCRIARLQEQLRAHGQRIAADPLWPDRATVGGVLATNDAGSLRLRFGGWRDLVIGTTVALADGTLASSGGKVVKNVAGYDLSKLMTGALGTLGVITNAVFRLHPLPRTSRTLSIAALDARRAQQIVAAVQDSRLAHAAAQVRASEAAGCCVDVLLEGTPAGVDAQTAALRDLAEAPIDEASGDVWQARQELWSPAGSGPVVKIGSLVAELACTIDLVRRLADAAQVRWHAVLHATGLCWVRFVDVPADWPALVRDLRGGVAPRRGSVTILRPPPGQAADPPDAWDDVGDARSLMAEVKRQFDPNGTLNPGRFAGAL